MTSSGFPPISDYAFLSDCHSCALIGRDASVEWACFHRFDSSPAFARILDRDRGGHFRIAPTGEWRGSRRYLPQTNVLETRFETPSGVVSVTDCLPLRGDPEHPGASRRPDPSHLLIRVVRGLEGRVETGLEFKPRFEYGLTTPMIRMHGDDLLVALGGAAALVLQSELGPLSPDESGAARARAIVKGGDELVVAMTQFDASELEVSKLEREDLLERVEETVRFWGNWTALCEYEGPYREAVERSALAIKGLTDARTGAIVAAATTSLPEEIGGERNWDYRYCWIRDSVALLGALARLGHGYEARRFGDWVLRTTAGRPAQLQIMYGIGGERLLTEAELPHLSGYRDSRPVRIGNGAWDQLQVDIYGALGGVTWFLAQRQEKRLLHDRARIDWISGVIDEAIEKFELRDEGIWEVRGDRQHFLFSKLMGWVAVDRGIKTAELVPDAFEPRLPEWRAAREKMRSRIEQDGVDPKSGAFTQAFGSSSYDAAALHVGLMGFLPFEDPRVQATIEAVDRELSHGGHIFRYRASDGLEGDEGAFTFCTLWMVSCLARSGQLERARERFEMVLSHASDLGLLSEEIDVESGEQIGNFPQAFSHVGVISAALAIAEAEAAR
jgi:GH15 family glucan-1,4-alpha-glucosidase